MFVLLDITWQNRVLNFLLLLTFPDWHSPFKIIFYHFQIMVLSCFLLNWLESQNWRFVFPFVLCPHANSNHLMAVIIMFWCRDFAFSFGHRWLSIWRSYFKGQDQKAKGLRRRFASTRFSLWRKTSHRQNVQIAQLSLQLKSLNKKGINKVKTQTWGRLLT